jgi:hypothetical protein
VQFKSIIGQKDIELKALDNFRATSENEINKLKNAQIEDQVSMSRMCDQNNKLDKENQILQQTVIDLKK